MIFWYLSQMQGEKAQASKHTKKGSRWRLRPKRKTLGHPLKNLIAVTLLNILGWLHFEWFSRVTASIDINICFGSSKEPSHWDGSFVYPQHMFWLRNKKFNIFTYTLLSRPDTHAINIICNIWPGRLTKQTNNIYLKYIFNTLVLVRFIRNWPWIPRNVTTST